MRLNNTINVSALFLISIVLSACGGGGGGSSSASAASVTITCPNGTSQTAATQALADAACPAPQLVSISPANGNTSVSPDTFAGILTTTDSTLDPNSITTANITLTAGGITSVSGSVAITGSKGFTFTPAAKLNYVQSYNFGGTVKDTLGKSLTFSSTFTTASVSCTSPLVPNSAGTACVNPPPACTAPAMLNSVNVCMSPPAATGYTWNNVMQAWVADISVKVVKANQVTVGCVNWRDQCWLDNVANGTVKWIATPAVATGLNTRPIVFAYFMNGAPVVAGVNGAYSTTIFYADTGEAFSNNVNTGNTLETDWAVGTTNGLITHKVDGTCFEYHWNGTGAWVNTQVTCPSL